MAGELSGKIAFVTGSGRGLGRVMAERLAETRRRRRDPRHRLDRAGEVRRVRRSRRRRRRQIGRSTASAPSPSPATSATTTRSAKMKAEIDADARPGRHPGQLRRRRHRRLGRQAEAQQRARHPFEDIQALTNNNLIGTMLVCQAFVPPMVERGARLGDQHRLGRRASRLLAGGGLRHPQGGGRPLHPLPRQGADRRRRARQRGQPRPDQDRPLPGDAQASTRYRWTGARSLNRYAEPVEIADAVAFLAGAARPLHQRPGASASTAASPFSRGERSYVHGTTLTAMT